MNYQQVSSSGLNGYTSCFYLEAEVYIPLIIGEGVTPAELQL